MNPNIVVLAERKNNELDTISYELLTKGKQLADAKGGTLTVLLAGYDTGDLHDPLKKSAADKVVICESPLLTQYNAEIYSAAIADTIKKLDGDLLLCGSTYFGIETGTLVAAKTGREMISNCSDLQIKADQLQAVRPVFKGNFLTKVDLDSSTSYVVSFEKGAVEKEMQEYPEAVLEIITPTIDEAAVKTTILEVIKLATGDVDITQSNILVSVGRGIGEIDKIQLVQDLADALGGVVSCSRPVADMGWLPPHRQVGISANYVSPDVYIACGISGASQHVAAMRDAGTIIAINSDPNAPIFRIAHYGIVGDLFEVIPELIKQAK